eukprot:6490336-Pyramimonas_sp.AAC.1
MRDRWPSVSLCVMVDGITLEAIGSARFVRQTLAAAVPGLCKQLQHLGQVVSRKKCQVLASTKELAAQHCKDLRAYCFKVCASVKNLGRDFGMQARA